MEKPVRQLVLLVAAADAASAGESVSALKAEMAIENAMVSENCL